MRKRKQILEQADANITESGNAVSVSDTLVAGSKQSMAAAQRAMTGEPEKAKEETNFRVGMSRQVAQDSNTVNLNQLSFPVVGVGASAGGLEALQEFFKYVKVPSKAAFVIVQHLSPDHHSFMRELLSRYTSIPVDFVEDGMKLKSNHIYLIPPNGNITLQGGVLHLTPIMERGLNLPIDIFFRSLADDQQSNAVAIILSGAGTDGTLGIRSIKEYGGIAMVQDPRDAKFDGMPKSALSTDMVDLVRPAGELAEELMSFFEHPMFTHPGGGRRLLPDNQTLYSKIMTILKDAKKVDFSSYRKETIVRRLEKRVSINRFTDLPGYVDFLSTHPEEVDTLFHEILIGVTRFFRDAMAFDTLRKICLPLLFKNCVNGKLRVWVASCSTGEEAYSIAMLLKEYMMENRIMADVKIFATDIDDKSLKFASAGVYPRNVVADVPPAYLAKYFFPRGSGYQVNPDIRRMIVFAAQDLIDNPPFFKVDLVTCRNFLIYICPEAQQRVLSSFYTGLKEGGFLFLGPSESLDKLNEGFDTLAPKERIFRKRAGFTPEYSPRSAMPLHLSMLDTPAGRGMPRDRVQDTGEMFSVMEQISNAFLPPSLIIDSNHKIIYAIREGGKLLNISSGPVSTNLLKILPKDLSLIVSSIVRRAEGKPDIIAAEVTLNGTPTLVKCKQVASTHSGATYYFISFETIDTSRPPLPMSDVKPADLSNRYQERIDELERALTQQRESLRIAVEQLETSNEELQASNEELVASNEELQSSNEELQSVNEELYTVNIEHVRKLDEITELNYDYDNLLSNTQIGTLFLDSNLVIRKISRIASKLTDILQSDIGRSLSYFSLKKLYPNFVKDVVKVNTTKKMVEKDLHLKGKTFCMRIVPYVVEGETNRGIIISFVDLTACTLRAIRDVQVNRKVIQTYAAQLDAAAMLTQTAYFQFNERTRKCTGSKLLPKLWPMKDGLAPRSEDWVLPEDLPEIHQFFAAVKRGETVRAQLNFRSMYYGTLRYYRIGVSAMDVEGGDRIIAGAIQNITEVIQSQQRREAQEKLWNEALDSIPVMFYVKDADDEFRYRFANRSYLDFLDRTLNEVVGKTDKELGERSVKFCREDRKAVECEGDVSSESVAELADGNVRYFHTLKRRGIGADGNRLLFGMAGDVTEQHLITRDLQIANQCLSDLLEAKTREEALQNIMERLCVNMGASHSYWLSFDFTTKKARCDFEYVRPGEGKPMFGIAKELSYTEAMNWYQEFQEGQPLDIADLWNNPESVEILRMLEHPDAEPRVKGLYSIPYREKGQLKGAIGFFFTGRRPHVSRERLANLAELATNLFQNACRLPLSE